MGLWLYDHVLLHLMQLFPLTYRATTKEGKRKVYWVWKMWLGQYYHIDKVYYTKGMRMKQK